MDTWLHLWLVVVSEAANVGVLPKRVFLEILQNSQENICARVSFLIKLQALGKIHRKIYKIHIP